MKSSPRKRGLVHLAEIIFNRIVPVWLLRVSVGDVFEIDVEKLPEPDRQDHRPNYRFAKVPDARAEVDKRPPEGLADQRARLRRATRNPRGGQATAADHGYAVIADTPPGQIVGGVWVAEGEFIEGDLRFEIRLRPEQVWVYCAHIDRSVRGNGLYRDVLATAARDTAAHARREVLLMAKPWNRASIHVHRKYSRRRVGRVFVVRLLAVAAVWCRGDLAGDRRLGSASRPVRITIGERTSGSQTPGPPDPRRRAGASLPASETVSPPRPAN